MSFYHTNNSIMISVEEFITVDKDIQLLLGENLPKRLKA